ncbi:hypothetical protein A3H38_01650 [candidate division WOR-1 bacterium RIFCSPLOWO2_02_FULL_46_20]|uniref:Cell envelope-related transcriptional attenuator domain-containing protein n=2 Tax=Saganbacteria TaxID=1703751 RepID=A0A1F4RH06_UNCSA|nr:MAG: hypothetical protein A3J44_03665 [candidate division WOR-1 bacterium RIFCSPHIGHO2_02_FULL_45_12]OGC07494.1 MAG: hypothetical protein A3H38_01650 [candidate division WOR-1 bacterium RIFCSPLOWO2_02_FULL_46_20]OGC09788.1 MAG: hypothetical protein A3F86_05805 [candidate division WOR-1 bacterium RIFCSPLOWO2_12_FULL_45_9]
MKRFLIITTVILAILSASLGFGVAIASKLTLLKVFLSLAPTNILLPTSNILVLGIDDAFGHRSDTIMVLHANPENKEASLISVPRDTLAVLHGHSLGKINHAYAYGGIELARKSVEDLLNVDIPYYLCVNLSGIVNIIDELGGITIDVEHRMYYVDSAGDLNIDLNPGLQKLSGKQAMGYVRFRSDGGDFSRIARQQKFIQALANELIKRDNVLRSPKLFLGLLSYVDTNLSSKQVLGLSLSMRTAFELGRVYLAVLPGTDLMVDGIYYWQPDKAGLKNIVEKYICGKQVIT